ncbi:MAG: hypothetical protein IPJ01_12785 [Micavibrio sp.]|nr:hypothetical protein [Micavibrio sp.]
MASPKIISLRFPAGGVNRRLGFQSQAPYTCVDALNVRPDSVIGHRERGGSRPGTGLSHRGTLGSGNPIRMLGALDVIETTGLTYWQDTFDGTGMGTVWSKPAWLDSSPRVASGMAYGETSDGNAGAVRSAFPTLIDTAKDYVVEVFVASRTAKLTGTYRIFARMDNATPNVSSSGVEARLTINSDGTHQVSLLANGSALITDIDAGTTSSLPGWFSLRISGNNAWVYWLNETTFSNVALGSHSGQRVGFALEADAAPAEAAIDAFRVQYYLAGGNQRTNRRIALASANGLLYREDWLGSMAQVTSDLTLASDRSVQCQQRLQKLYIADTGEWKKTDIDGSRGTGNAKFDATSVSDWTTLGIDTDDDVLVIYDSTEPAKLLDGVYKISSVASGELTLTTDCATDTGGTASWYITRAPKVYDYKTNALTQWTATVSKGFVPPTQPLICLYRDRLVLAGGSDSPHLWYMSRQGDPLDWNYGATDPARAVAGLSSQAGVIGEPITALCPHGDICLVIGCKSSLWILRGDPAYGGQIDNLSHNIGIVDKFAWTYVPNVSADNSGTLIFLSLDGVYMLGAGCGASEPISISREKMPEELLHVDSNLVEAQLTL